MTATLPILEAPAPYVAYAYSYPHKTAYRPLVPPVPLEEAWAAEERGALFLYLHVPFCEMRCGFCNLFTTANPQDDLVALYLNALERQARSVRAAIGPVTIARMAIGGGTPTYLDPAGLHALFDLAEALYGARGERIPISVETSPRTAEPDRLRALRERGVDRISIGVQSFVEAEVAASGRAQQTAMVEQALDLIRAAGFPTLNIDLIYGLPGQTPATWEQSLRAALRFAPEELYLYPLYVRPLTGLNGRVEGERDLRLECYRAARALLAEAGYEQVSMRMFRKEAGLEASHIPQSGTRAPARIEAGGLSASAREERSEGVIRNPQSTSPVYCCQEDGMLGLGCGARSYTRKLHYATEYAVGARGVREILADYVGRPEEAFAVADYGFRLDGKEERRRYVIQTLLQVEGLPLDAYRDRFGGDAREDLPELFELEARGLAQRAGRRFRLTNEGLERSDVIGPWLFSERVRRWMAEFPLR